RGANLMGDIVPGPVPPALSPIRPSPRRCAAKAESHESPIPPLCESYSEDMTTLRAPRSIRATAGLAGRLPLITGALWMLVAWLVLGFNRTSVATIAALAGAVILAAGVAELYLMMFAPGWKWLHGLLGALFIVTGIFAWINPGSTVFWLAAFIGWYLLFKGV